MWADLLLVVALPFVLLIIFLWDENRAQPNKEDRCPVCGFLVDGPLHDENKCETEREVRSLSSDQIRGRELFRMNRDKLGF